jgi:hypothetical protein
MLFQAGLAIMALIWVSYDMEIHDDDDVQLRLCKS